MQIESKEEWFTCRLCETEYEISNICDHLPSTHIWCYNCCKEFYKVEHDDFRSDLD